MSWVGVAECIVQRGHRTDHSISGLLLNNQASETQALYQPQDDSYFSAASELLDMRNKAIKEQLVWDKGQSSDQGMDRIPSHVIPAHIPAGQQECLCLTHKHA